MGNTPSIEEDIQPSTMVRAAFGAAAAASCVIDLLDDDDDIIDIIDIDLDRKPAAVGDRKKKTAAKPSPIRDGEVQLIKGPPETARNRKRKDRPGGKPRWDDVQVLDEPPLSMRKDPPENKPPSHLMRVLEIFPDADVSYVKKKLREQNNNIEVVVALLSENDNYPKEKKNTSVDTPNAYVSGVDNAKSTIIREMKAAGPKHEYSSPNAVFERSPKYLQEVFDLLLYDFSFLKKRALTVLLLQHKRRYTLTRNKIHDMIVGVSPNAKTAAASSPAKEEAQENENYQILRSVLIRGSLPRGVRQRIGQTSCLSKPRRKIGVSRPVITDPVLKDELFYFEQKFGQWLTKVQDRLRCKAANKMALENGSAVKCSCCFDDVARSECVPCKDNGVSCCGCELNWIFSVKTSVSGVESRVRRSVFLL